MSTKVGGAPTSGGSVVEPTVPSRPMPIAESIRVVRSSAGTTRDIVGLRDELRALGTERLLDIVLSLASQTGCDVAALLRAEPKTAAPAREESAEIGRASCRERV